MSDVINKKNADTINTATTTPKPFQPASIDCDFGTDMCGWKQDGVDFLSKGFIPDKYDWYLSNTSVSGTTSKGARGGGDRTGGFIYVNSENIDSRWTNCARLWSPMIPSGEWCFRFFYRATYLTLVLFNQGSREEWHLRRYAALPYVSGSSWASHSVTVGRDEPFELMLAGFPEGSEEIRVDDVTLTAGACPTEPRSTTAGQPENSTHVDSEADSASWQAQIIGVMLGIAGLSLVTYLALTKVTRRRQTTTSTSASSSTPTTTTTTARAMPTSSYTNRSFHSCDLPPSVPPSDLPVHLELQAPPHPETHSSHEDPPPKYSDLFPE